MKPELYSKSKYEKQKLRSLKLFLPKTSSRHVRSQYEKFLAGKRIIHELEYTSQIKVSHQMNDNKNSQPLT